MEEENKILPDYQTGFNEGYTIAKYSPELAGQLSRISADGDRFIGFQEGREQFLKEQVKEIMPAWLKDNRAERNQDSISKDREKENDKDIDPEP